MKQLGTFVAIWALSSFAQAQPDALVKSVMSQLEGATAKQFQLGPVKAKCDTPPAKPKNGDTFHCTATTKDKQEIDFVAKITIGTDDKIHVSLTATNLLTHETIAALIKKVLPELVDQTKEKLEEKDVDCGSHYAFKNQADMLIPCTVTMPSNAKKLKAEIHVTKERITVDVEVATKPVPKKE